MVKYFFGLFILFCLNITLFSFANILGIAHLVQCAVRRAKTNVCFKSGLICEKAYIYCDTLAVAYTLLCKYEGGWRNCTSFSAIIVRFTIFFFFLFWSNSNFNFQQFFSFHLVFSKIILRKLGKINKTETDKWCCHSFFMGATDFVLVLSKIFNSLKSNFC